MQSHRYGFPVALSNGVLRGRMTTRRIIPMTCVVDRDGRLRQAIPGEMSEEDVMGLAQAALRPSR
jgi:peroxiredoxin